MCARLQTQVLLFIVIPFLAASAYAATPIIKSVTVVGNSAFSTREVRGWLSAKQSLDYSEMVLKSDQRTIVQEYHRLGYFDARIDSIGSVFDLDSSFVELTIFLNEGRQRVVGSLKMNGQKSLTETEILNVFDTRIGSPLDASVLERDIDALLARYEDIGYPFAHCQVAAMVERPGDEHDFLDIVLSIDEGEHVTIDEIRVEGNTETDASVVVRETRLGVGEVFDPEKINAIRQRLKRLNIFADVSEPQLYMRGDKGGLLIKVQEGNTNTFDGVIGYIPGTSTGESGFVTGLASVSMRNLFGTGRKLSFRWHREDRFSQELGIRYLEAWIFSLPVNIGGGFFQRKQDTSYVRRILDLKSELMISEELSIGLLFSTESVIPSSVSTISRVFKSSTVTIGGELQYDTRDDIYSPTSGARYRTDYQYGRKRISSIPASLASLVPEKVTVQRFSLDLDFFLTTFARQVFAFGFHGRELRSGQIDESEMFRFGGTNSLRGYRENQFLGSRIAWSNAEYRFLMARRSFIYGFIDTGYYMRVADDVRGIPKIDAFKYGYGIGVQLETGLGNLGVSFALGEGDSFSNGKVHFGLINEF
jgi:outer membrane protein insertion porin family